MTMADPIVVMNGGRIEQLGSPTELYERPRTAFVAGFLGVSNLLDGDGRRRGTPSELDGRRRSCACRASALDRAHAAGRRSASGPEKLRARRRTRRTRSSGRVAESAYIGVSTQYVVDDTGRRRDRLRPERPAGRDSVAPGDAARRSAWSPERTFVVDARRRVTDDRLTRPARSFLRRAAAGGIAPHRARPPRRLRRRQEARGDDRRRNHAAAREDAGRSRTGRSTSTYRRRTRTRRSTSSRRSTASRSSTSRTSTTTRRSSGRSRRRSRSGQSIGRDIVVLTDNSPLSGAA